MKITIYTIPDCQFSKQEKDYLIANKLTYEEKNLEANREFLTEMMTLSNNFAGTPVTKVEKDDGQIAVLKGFTKDEFDKTLGLSQPAKPVEPALSEMNAQINVPTAPTPQPQQPTEPARQQPEPQAMAGGPPPTQPTPPIETPKEEAPKTEDQLKSVLDDLKQKTDEPSSQQQTPPAVSNPSTTPSIPDFK